MGRITFITGGARSGKSTYAEKLARESNKKVAYIATSIAFDDGMKNRIKKHREQRPKEWKTIEKYRDFDKISEINEYEQSEILLVDCVTVMLNNLMFYSGLDFDTCTVEEVDILEKEILLEVEKLLRLSSQKDMIVVSNELGMGLVPAYKMGSYYRDIAGRINQLVASRADDVFLVVSGLQIKLK
ncbi:bifunctional adenosylcobinamide kinase/adenosylcobinamide-phosphate guanylyltransferase [Alkalibaculum sp. M08DMB]|uniref:Adenosylcobinamide kinase n=1 Tax=Alkalibaculum sporogenes TaxID=2655001 RepID=A0A6A7KCA6_9FIRM|nr:bifunctional adenosylcobinamide kinase/adenosylcobinamide-phosphate guanylyltransferase [Alkalibaculum sporogenes]MPW26931.1 bifunctional adenosylcobinamide kinase/adenosylcobinamide-phosphate guanylyltransferase [Alkalibaculum sporogenes]